MARKRASMREGPLAELFRATEAAQRQVDSKAPESTPEPEPVPGREPETPPAAAAAPAVPERPAVVEPPPVETSHPAGYPPRPEQAAPAEERPAARWVEPLP